MQTKDINQYEILEVCETLVLVRTIKPLCLDKAKAICSYLSNKTKRDVFWYNNLEEEEIEIYTEKGNLQNAKNALKEFEVNYNNSFKKRQMIIKHRHKI